MNVTDAHAHLDMDQFAGDLPQVLQRAAEAGARKVISVGTDLGSSRRCVELARRFPGRIFAAVGLHPNHAGQAAPDDVREIARLAALDEVVAIGETGLDFHHAYTSPAEQISSFERHIGLALAAGKPLIIHARKSDEEVLRILAEQGGPLRGVRHCFDGSAQIAREYLDLDLHISLAGTVTRPGYKKLKAAVRGLPADRLLVETDCPYQTPAPHAGMRNEPAFILDTVRAIAVLRDETPEAIAAITMGNCERLFFQAGASAQGL